MRFVLYLAIALWGVALPAQDSYNLQANQTITIDACDGILYDSGGPEADYQEEISTATISSPGADFYELTFFEFAVENAFDRLSIYAGSVETGTLIGTYDGFDLPNDGQPIQVPGNVVTVVFDADFSIEYTGFGLVFSCGNIDTPPVADFSAPANTCSGAVAFVDQSTGFATSWSWDFGDGNMSTAQSPQHFYSTPGTYDVSLTSCNSAGCNTITVTEAVTYDPDTEFCTSGTNMPDFGEAISTDCQGILFDPGGPDGDYAANTHSQFFITPTGASSITVTFSEFNLGDEGEHTDLLYLYDPVNFTALGFYQGNELPNGGQPISLNVSSLMVILSTDAANNFSGFALEWSANGSNEAPVAGYAVSDDNPALGAPVQFTDTSTNGPGQWFWDFGDGNSSTEQNPVHVYTIPGTYTVSLTVTNCVGGDVISTQSINVQEAPALTYDPESYNITLDAGTLETGILNLCNVGLGDLLVGSSVTGGEGSTTGALSFQLITNENGADFSWFLQNSDFVVLQSGDGYTAFETIDLLFTNLDVTQEYYLVLNSPEGVQALESFLWFDPSGNIIFEEALATGPDLSYVLPPAFEVPATSWLSLSGTSSQIPADLCTELTVMFDATDLNGGVYESSIILTSNDPNQPNVVIPVTMTVIGTPAISISTDNLDFGDVQVGATPSLSVTIQNTGTDLLTIDNLASSEAAFQLGTDSELTLTPGQSRTVDVTFAPTAIQAYNTTLSLTNNAGDDQTVTLTGNGIAAPSLTVDPLAFSAELVAGETATFMVNVGNIGEAPLTYNASIGGDGIGFTFEFTTDNWGGEFSWTLVDAAGNTVSTSEGIFYDAFTTYTETLTGLSSEEDYTLIFFDTFADGSLTNYSVTDIGSGAVVASGDFLENVPTLNVPLGSPQEASLTVTPQSGTLTVSSSEQLTIFADTDGWSTGTYNYIVDLATNDPLQPNVPISVTLFVIAPVEVDFSAAPTTVCGNLPVQFTDLTENVATSWAWDFGDGTTSTEQNPSHLYTADGSYTVSLTACNSLGCETVAKTDYISVELDCYTQNIPAGHQTETITVCSGNVYDSGGPTGDYLEGNFGSLIIAPPGAEQVSITFAEFNYEEHADFLYVYDGNPNTGNAIFLGSFTGNDLAGQTLVATSGVLVLQEYTGHFTQLSGFVATFFCDSEPQLPVANFSPNEDALCFGEARLFNDLSTGAIDTWLWEFGDGSTSLQQNPAYVYLSSGVYTVSLTVCNDEGCDTYVEEVTIEINTDCNIENVPENEVTYINNCAGQLFDSGGADGNYLDNNNSAVTLIRPGGGIFLTFTEFDFAAGDYLALIEGDVASGNIIAFYTADNPPVLNETININGEIATIIEVTDGADNATGFRLEYSCPAFGPEDGSALQVINDDLCDGLRTFRTDPNLGYNSWSWNFGDGHTSGDAAPTHTYTSPGMYEVSVEACLDGDCDTYTIMLYSNKLVPEIEAPEMAFVGQEVYFEGITETATHWTWDFGNGETVTDHTPSTVYSQPGVYEVNVHLMNMNVHETCDATHTHSITINSSTTSVEEVTELAVSLFPNPTTSRIFLRWDTGVDQVTAIRVYDQRGRLLLESPPVNELDLEAFSAGNYIVELRFAENPPVRKRVIRQ